VTDPSSGFTYARYYKGSGFTENSNNPGNNMVIRPPHMQNYPASTDACTAINNCASYAVSLPEVYYQFAVYFFTSQNQWQCVAYYNGNIDGSYFNVPNSDVAVGLGYNIVF
jgi:hypothetical protein